MISADLDSIKQQGQTVPLPQQLGPGERIDFAAHASVITNDPFYLAVRDSQGNDWLVPQWNLLIVKVQAGAIKAPWIVRHLLTTCAQRIARR